MHNVLRSIVAGGMVGVSVGIAVYMLLAPHGNTIQGVAQVLLPQGLSEKTLPFLAQAVILFTALVLAVFGFAVAFLTAGAYLSSRSKA